MIVTVESWATPPRVKIETTAASVWRVQDGTSVPVRGTVTGGAVYDYEIPQATPVAYDDGLAVSALVEMPDVGVWLIPPAQPELGVQLTVDLEGFPGWTRETFDSILPIPGRDNAVGVSFGRSARSGALTVLVLEADEFAALSACLDVSGPMLLSFPPSHWPAFGLVSWVLCGQASETPYGTDDQQTWRVSFPLTPVDRPEFVQASGLTWDDLATSWSSLASSWTSLEKA